ncbi:MAG TPA: DUF2497 domain-containing protein [Hellea balneolensis]|uniref:DUF2497 domain-containing protein n=1 Tax=Hellea balneolensis TaxID=287478 RepID=A0A7C5LVC6_9PROT|nr:DUF2497 domain-containing protein [Hellea balneolensis]
MEETLESEVQQAVAEAMPQQDEKLEVHAEDLETEPQAENIQDPQDPTPHIEETNEMMKPVDINKLVDEETDREATEAFASLNQAVREKTRLEESGPPIGDLVQEALKPMLQEWLDKNLKGIVERAVTKEIKRISSGK